MEGAPVYNPLSSSNSYKQNTFISKNYIEDWKPKDALREVLSKDPKAIKKINKIIHPLVKQEVIRFIKDNSKGIVCVEVPLLFESKMDDLFDVLIGVEAPLKKQKQLLSTRDGDKAKQLETINSASTYDKNKEKADFIINNDSDLKSLNNKVINIINKLKSRLD